MNPALPTVRELPVEPGMPVLVRADLDVPVEAGEVQDDTLIRALLPTLRRLQEQSARIVVCGHRGRPGSRRVAGLSLEPVAARLAELLEAEILFSHDTIGEHVRDLAEEMPAGGLMVLENLRFNEGEETADPEFARQLAQLGRLLVMDSFESIHRPHASVVGLPSYLETMVGIHLEEELDALERLLQGPERPFVAVMGGAMAPDRVGLIESLARRCDSILVGGALSYTFMAAQGRKVGRSLVDPDKVLLARRVLERCAERGVTIYLPVDHVVAEEPGAEVQSETVREIPDEFSAFDVGRETTSRYLDVLSRAGTIFWDGPMGLSDLHPFAEGTRALARGLASMDAFRLVAGAGAVSAIAQLGLQDQFNHLSTGAAACLEFLEGKEPAGIRALRTRSN